MLLRSCLLWLLALCSAFTVNATNYRADSFELYSSQYYRNTHQVLESLRFQEIVKHVLIHGDILTPIQYSGGSSFYLNKLMSPDQGIRWDEADISNLVSVTDLVNVYEGDFNGDSHQDLLLQQIGDGNPNTGSDDQQLLIVYGSSTDLPLKIQELWAPNTKPSNTMTGENFLPAMMGSDYASVEVIDLNGDGKDDIKVTYTLVASSGQQAYGVFYGTTAGQQNYVFETPTKQNGGAVASKPNNGTVVPGGSGASFRVNESGAATLSMPLYSPKGPAGMTSSLALSYSSHSGNGPFGLGWNLQGGSSITTCPVNNYTSTDTTSVQYCLNGQKLIRLASGSGGTSMSQYFATEVSDISRVIAEFANSSSKHPYKFVVDKKDGTRETLVLTANEHWATKTLWNPTKSAYLEYEYQAIGGVTVPGWVSKVSLKSKTGSELSSTKFNYATRPDTRLMYLNGTGHSLSQRVENIEIYQSSKLVRKYYLSYGQSSFSDQSTLTYIQECGLQGQCYEPLKLDWSNKNVLDSHQNLIRVDEPQSSNEIHEVFGADFDRDGNGDFAVYSGVENENGQKITLYEGTGGGIAYWWGGIELTLPDTNLLVKRKVQVVDFNTDGAPDVLVIDIRDNSTCTGNVGFDDFSCDVYRLVEVTPYLSEIDENKSGWGVGYKISKSSTYSFNSPLKRVVTLPGAVYDIEWDQNFQLIDINGDALLDMVDLIAMNDGEARVYIQNRTNGLGFNLESQSISSIFDLSSFNDPDISCAWKVDEKLRSLSDIHYHDFDNDGFIDALLKAEAYCDGIGNGPVTGWYVLYSKFGTLSKHVEKVNIEQETDILAVDFNGDSLVDIHTDSKLLLNKGDGGFESVSPRLSTVGDLSLTQSYMPVDLNSDGLIDFVHMIDRKTFYEGYNNGYSIHFYSSLKTTDLDGNDDYIDSLINLDLNGDSLQDIIVTTNKGWANTYVLGIKEEESPFSDSKPADVIEKITASNGQITNVTYGTRSDYIYYPEHVSIKSESTWSDAGPVFDANPSLHLVKSVSEEITTESGTEHVLKDYIYKGGKIQIGRGFLGFRLIQETDKTNGIVNVTEYAQTYPYIGMPLYSVKAGVWSSGIEYDDSGVDPDVSLRNIQKSGNNTNLNMGLVRISSIDPYGNTTTNNKSACLELTDYAFSSTPLSCARNILNVKEFSNKHADSNAVNNPVFPYVETTVEEVFHTQTDFDATEGKAVTKHHGGLLKTIVTENEYAGAVGSFYGELTKQTSTTSVMADTTKISHIKTSSFKYEQNNVQNWWLGRMTEQVVETQVVEGTHQAPTYNATVWIADRDAEGKRLTTGRYESRVVSGQSYASLQNYDLAPLADFLDDSRGKVTRKTRFNYYSNSGLLRNSILEPDSTDFSYTTEYQYDDFGNKSAVLKYKNGSQSSDFYFYRKSGVEYDANGIYSTITYEYPDGTTSRVASEILSRNELGQPTQARGLNDVITSKSYDGFGRETSTSTSLGSSRLVSRKFCYEDLSCPSNLGYMVTEVDSNTGPDTKTITDSAGLTLRAGKQGFDGQWLYVDKKYDIQGRPISVSNPHAGSYGTATYWTDTLFDLFSRPLRTVFADGSVSEVQYNGLYTTTTDTYGLSKASLVNAENKVVYVREFKGLVGESVNFKSVRYKYDLVGNQTQIIGDGQTVQTEYDLFGKAIKVNDPSKGEWTYTYNALGELINQRNAKGDYTTNTYDDLGRLTHRTIKPITSENNGELTFGSTLENTTWTYDNKANGLGKLGSISGSFNYNGIATTYGEEYTYNSKSQLQDKTSTVDGRSYKESWTYDSVGRVSIHYDASNSIAISPTLGTKSHYNSYGYGYKTTNATATQTLFEALESDDWGNITKYQFGNGVETTKYFNEATGRLVTLSAGAGTNKDEILDHVYAFDDLGNLDYKKDMNLGYKEDVTYDITYRVKKVATTGLFTGQEGVVAAYNLDMSYHALNSSNIKTKSTYENGAQYTYGGTTSCNGQTCGTHVLTSVGNRTFEYDANGNRIVEKLSGLIERQAEYTSIDKPWKILKGDNSSYFAYGAGLQRIKQVTTKSGVSETLHYVGNVEWTEKSGVWTYKRRIGGFAFEEEGESIKYQHKDYQGTVLAISDESGVLVQRLSFDIYGARRNVLYNHSTGFIKPTSAMYDKIGSLTYDESLSELVRKAAIDQRGYTSHEHLDAVGLIHMNGRVYDAASALFLSADPNLPDISDQHYLNRYSYTLNNPVSYTDPSGYFGIKEFANVVKDVDESLTKFDDKLHSPEGRMVLAIAITAATGGYGLGWAIAGGFASGYVMTGTLQGAVVGAVFAGASYGVGSIGQHMAKVGTHTAMEIAVTKFIMHGAIGGIRAQMAGGSFKSGFFTAGVTSALGEQIGRIESAGGQILAAAVLGGATSRVSGGSFANGAITAAFVHAYNHQNHATGREELINELREDYPELAGMEKDINTFMEQDQEFFDLADELAHENRVSFNDRMQESSELINNSKFDQFARGIVDQINMRAHYRHDAASNYHSFKTKLQVMQQNKINEYNELKSWTGP